MNITVVDYGLGNTQSVLNAIRHKGAKAVLSSSKNEILSADALILPGVGSFAHGMKQLESYDLIDTIKAYAETGKPLLGICLGMQLFFSTGYEFGVTKGLGLIDGCVQSLTISTNFSGRIPHIGWAPLKCTNDTSWNHTILEDITKDDEVYFVHSYTVNPKDINNMLAKTVYQNIEFCSVVMKGNIYGCQFHPEKSGEVGLRILENFINNIGH